MKVDAEPRPRRYGPNLGVGADFGEGGQNAGRGGSPRAPPHSRTYQPPVRDEESESQRKARSRMMRQSRRSTQVWGRGDAVGGAVGG